MIKIWHFVTTSGHLTIHIIQIAVEINKHAKITFTILHLELKSNFFQKKKTLVIAWKTL